MPNKYALLKEVLGLLDEYETAQEGREASVVGFSAWLNQKIGYFSMSHWGRETDTPVETRSEGDQATMLTMLIVYLYRYAKHYTKKALENTPLSTLDEFGFLISLLETDSMTKSELINLHLLEMTSGIEIIKRLTRQGLLDSFPDPEDRRSRRVRLTDAGLMALGQALGNMQKATRIVSGDLSTDDRTRIMSILNRLSDFHAVIHTQDRKSELDLIVDKYLKDK